MLVAARVRSTPLPLLSGMPSVCRNKWALECACARGETAVSYTVMEFKDDRRRILHDLEGKPPLFFPEGEKKGEEERKKEGDVRGSSSSSGQTRKFRGRDFGWQMHACGLMPLGTQQLRAAALGVLGEAMHMAEAGACTPATRRPYDRL
eukprot:364208-Chlamydomonas_euryale.AAC.25